MWVRVPRSTRTAIEAAAAEYGCTMAEVITRALEIYLPDLELAAVVIERRRLP